MSELANRTIDFLGSLPPDALIGALFLALVVAVATAGAYRGLTGQKPAALMVLVCLVLLANLASTLVAVGFVQSTVPTYRVVERRGSPPQDRIINLYDHVAPPDSPVEPDAWTTQDP
jgi:hypothetical protein